MENSGRCGYHTRPWDATTDLAARLERIKELTDKYLTVQNDSVEARRLAERISREVDLAKLALRVLRMHDIEPT